ncbi:hypothetical protein [Magnetospirillum sp. SS-4]|uniref:capsid assembly protein n=1 Tax=Magnetospirillum sp. SS-4 TaxID=2681465 RepID=UPI001384320E|nr:hypothetical protein [Magnetospirillum sp. SS-4]CAA7627407.1 conserved hypothetical protein [Magnetospirillum sp. SS-4]
MHYEDSRAPDLEPARGGRPTNVPEKFWDPARGEIRTDALIRAYLELERRASSLPRAPDSFDKYKISHRHPKLTSSETVNRRLHQAGFTQEQAQLVYDLAHDVLLPMLEGLTGESEQTGHLGQLAEYFGGEERWRQIAPQLTAWGRRNLPPDAFDALASSVEGVKIMHRLMGSGEPSLGHAPPPRDEGATEAELKKMLQDPRYWKTRDPAFIAKVGAGFRRLYGEG